MQGRTLLRVAGACLAVAGVACFALGGMASFVAGHAFSPGPSLRFLQNGTGLTIMALFIFVVAEVHPAGQWRLTARAFGRAVAVDALVIAGCVGLSLASNPWLMAILFPFTHPAMFIFYGLDSITGYRLLPSWLTHGAGPISVNLLLLTLLFRSLLRKRSAGSVASQAEPARAADPPVRKEGEGDGRARKDRPRSPWFRRPVVIGALVWLAAAAFALAPYAGRQRVASRVERLGGATGSYHEDDESGPLISFEGTQVGDDDIAFLKGRTELQCLDLRGTRITDEGLAHLAGLVELRSLDLSGTGITDEGLRHLAGMTRLTELRLLGTQVTDEGLRILSTLTGLTGLSLGNTRVTDEGLAHLAGMKELNSLGLHGTQVAGHGLARLRGLTRLEVIGLDGTRVTDGSLQHVAGLERLTLLNLSRTGIGDEGLGRLVHLKRLGVLGLEHTKITDEGVRQLAAMSALKQLHLDGTQVSDEGVAHLAGSPTLKSLFLRGTRVTPKGVAALKASLPDLWVEH